MPQICAMTADIHTQTEVVVADDETQLQPKKKRGQNRNNAVHTTER